MPSTTGTTSRYEFNESFQTKIAAMVLRSSKFNDQTSGLVKPDYFENLSEATVVNIALSYYGKFRRVPDLPILMQLIANALTTKKIRQDEKPHLIAKLKQLYKADISDMAFVVEEVSTFAQHQAMEIAILKSVDFLQKRDFEKIGEAVKSAIQVGAVDSPEYDYFAQITARTQERKDMLAGIIGPKGITTGYAEIDNLLMHKGWGRSELSVLMGGPKTGKSTGLLNACLFSVLSGYNTLYVTLEMSKEIASGRVDANVSSMFMNDLQTNPIAVQNAIQDLVARLGSKLGTFKINEYPSGTMSPADLERLIERYKANGVVFDMIAVDYLDIMRPTFRTNDTIENSKNVWIDCRAIAQRENIALLSATQTNRDGYKATTAKAEHAADDFNKVRTADLLITINKTEEEERNGEARLHFAAGRNQQGGMSVHIKQELAKMKFITAITGRS